MQISPLTMAITLVEYPAREHTLYQPNNSYTFITDSFHYSDNVCSDGCMLGTETIKLLASVMFMTWSSFSTLTPTVTHLTCLTLLSTQLVKESKPLNFKICSKMSMKFGMQPWQWQQLLNSVVNNFTLQLIMCTESLLTWEIMLFLSQFCFLQNYNKVNLTGLICNLFLLHCTIFQIKCQRCLQPNDYYVTSARALERRA